MYTPNKEYPKVRQQLQHHYIWVLLFQEWVLLPWTSSCCWSGVVVAAVYRVIGIRLRTFYLIHLLDFFPFSPGFDDNSWVWFSSREASACEHLIVSLASGRTLLRLPLGTWWITPKQQEYVSLRDPTPRFPNHTYCSLSAERTDLLMGFCFLFFLPVYPWWDILRRHNDHWYVSERRRFLQNHKESTIRPFFSQRPVSIIQGQKLWVCWDPALLPSQSFQGWFSVKFKKILCIH